MVKRIKAKRSGLYADPEPCNPHIELVLGKTYVLPEAFADSIIKVGGAEEVREMPVVETKVIVPESKEEPVKKPKKRGRKS